MNSDAERQTMELEFHQLAQGKKGDSGASEVEALRARTSINLLLTQSHHGVDSRRAAGR
jgi:hypothetical protein